MLTFAHLWLALLLPLPLLVRWLVPPHRRSRPALRVPFLNRIRGTGKTASSGTRQPFLAVVTKTLIWSLLVIALMRPQK